MTTSLAIGTLAIAAFLGARAGAAGAAVPRAELTTPTAPAGARRCAPAVASASATRSASSTPSR